MNVEAINAVADAIENHTIPWLGFNMNFVMNDRRPTWTPPDDDSDGWLHPDHTGHNCKTIACIAGWAYAVHRPEMCKLHAEQSPDRKPIDPFNIDEVEEIFGLDQVTVRELCFPNHVGDLEDITTEHAVRVLRHLVATGEVDWSVAK